MLLRQSNSLAAVHSNANIPQHLASRVADCTLLLSVLFITGFFEPHFNVLGVSDGGLQPLIAERSGSNALNQIKWLLLSIIASIPLICFPRRMITVASLSWPTLALCILCVISAAWSEHPDITMRRALGLAMSTYALMVGVAYAQRPERAAVVVYVAFLALLMFNLIALAVPGTFDQAGYYTGITSQKNMLGVLGVLGILIGLGVRGWLGSDLSRQLNSIYLLGWAALLILSVSKTSITLAIVVPMAIWLLSLLSSLVRLNVSIVLCSLVFFVLISFGLFASAAGMTPADVLHVALPDITFTGRTPIWDFMVQQIQRRWFAGYGFGAFWATGFHAPNLNSIYDYIRGLTTAHNGYFDLIANLGMLGLMGLLVFFIHFGALAETVRSRRPDIVKLVWMLMLLALVHNTMESTFLRPFDPLWHMTLFAVFLTARAATDPESR